MQNELGQAGSIGTDGVFYAPDVTSIAPIDVRDIARVAAHVCVNPGHDRRAYTLTGPQLLTYADIASIYSDVLGTPEGLSFAPSNHEFYAALAGLGWFLWRRTMLGTIVVGMVVFTFLRLVM